jgi:subtilase family serine protease
MRDFCNEEIIKCKNRLNKYQNNQSLEDSPVDQIYARSHVITVPLTFTEPDAATTKVTTTYFTPSQIRSAYGMNLLPNQTTLGQGLTIAIIIAYHYSNLQSDLNIYCTKYGLPSTTLNIINLAGKSSNLDWAIEECLDVQMIHTIAPYANIIVVEAKSNSTTDLWAAITKAKILNPSVISMSWSLSEYSGVIALDTIFSSSTNITFVAATGDNTDAIGYPSTSPNVIAVGGTSLTLTSSGIRLTETVWSDAGAGPSKYFKVPSYQSGLGLTYRNTPDISLIADPNTGVWCYCSIGGGYLPLGGTSVATPLTAAIIGLCNQNRITTKKPLLNSQALSTTTSVQHYLYQLIYKNSTLYSSYMYDVKIGIDGIYTAGTGYDKASGLGSLKINTLVPSFLSN